MSKKIIILTVIIVSTISLYVFNTLTTSDTSVVHNGTYSDIELYLQGQINEVGSLETHENLVRISKESEPSRKHLLGHIFGKVLYQEEGLGGFLVCDSRLQYGCIHEFVGQVLVESGTQIVQTLNDRCFGIEDKQLVLSCQHGIGHGLLSHLGYSEESLKEALSVCESLPAIDDRQMFGCYGGVFMEYNTQAMLGNEGEIRYSEDLFSPCSKVKDVYFSACAFWQPQWWRQAVLTNVEPLDAFAQIGSYCRDMSYSLETRESCFMGIGNLLPIDANLDSSLAVRMCDAGSSVFEDRMNCRVRAGRDFSNISHLPEASLVCAEMGQEEYQDCFIWLRKYLSKKD